MPDNTGEGHKTAHRASVVFRAFDNLPAEIRDALNNARAKWCPVEVSEMLAAGTHDTASVLEMIREADDNAWPRTCP